jgi:hypothetical protein
MWEAYSARRHSVMTKRLESPQGQRLPHLRRQHLNKRLRIVGGASNSPIEVFSRIEGIETGGTD